ncbi:hypothetical protein ANTPLA_LOCUS5483 [Anthophora plagiata]
MKQQRAEQVPVHSIKFKPMPRPRLCRNAFSILSQYSSLVSKIYITWLVLTARQISSNFTRMLKQCSLRLRQSQ